MRLREVFPKIGKLLTPTLKGKKVTHSDSSLKVESKYAIGLIPMKSYKKGFVFLLTLTLTIF